MRDVAVCSCRLKVIGVQVQMVGVAVQQAPWLVVIEFMPYGDLKGVLEVHWVQRDHLINNADEMWHCRHV